jgi:hypothetical protein
MGNHAVNSRPRSAVLAAVQATQAPPAQKASAKQQAEAPAKSAAGRDSSSTRKGGSASSSVVIYDLDQHKKRAPTKDELASIQQAAPKEKHFVAYKENGKPVMDIATEQEFQQLEANDKTNTPEAKADRRKERRINTAVSTGVGVAMDVGLGLKLAQASKVAATGAAVAKGATGLGMIGGKILPALGIVFGGVGIASDISRWNNPNNKKHGDDVARIAGNALSMVGSGLMIAGAGASATGVGAVAGVPLAAVGLVVSGVGLLVSGIGSWFDDDD